MIDISREELRAKLIFKKSQLSKELVEPKMHINKCDIHDVIDAAEALTTREKEHRLYGLKELKIQQLDNVIDKLSHNNDIECDTCGVSILSRLEVVPTAQRCFSCQTRVEKLKLK
ncbi:TraR/DksA family transcriptional regulator [Shewanella eurypsychrophilus]|uniref:TraR/DksA family transcriptional regulator n=1 Tax=Shewanella eurypsychrophilus TaxID=2593656 RepID=A0ABX6V956_9GAMM|nr:MULTISPECIES: TraR/DksA family transcriptional regulator [Shewanella]QFU23064.1 hypothetical protein FS418_15080 [Shewanella sp. YLB-09]QPG58347.1 TraR/DksA family transcriptional regulator [Shewanella eurypsychrophilus]